MASKRLRELNLHNFHIQNEYYFSCAVRPVNGSRFTDCPVIFHQLNWFHNKNNNSIVLTPISAILVLYLNQKLGYNENDASAMYHGFSMTIHLLCIVGGIISDVWLGKFRTILYFSIVYAFGCVAVSISAFPNIGISPDIVLIIGLILIAIGHGCIGPSSNAFGGDQYKLPEQAAQLATFFSMIYFAANIGALISTTLTPIFRSDVHCFGDDDCYSLAFGMPAILMIASIGELILNKTLCRH